MYTDTLFIVFNVDGLANTNSGGSVSLYLKVLLIKEEDSGIPFVILQKKCAQIHQTIKCHSHFSYAHLIMYVLVLILIIWKRCIISRSKVPSYLICQQIVMVKIIAFPKMLFRNIFISIMFCLFMIDS